MVMQNPVGPTYYGGSQANPVDEGNGQRFPSTFGLGADDGFSAASFVKSPRCQLLNWRHSFFKCTQHDEKTFDYQGQPAPMGPAYLRHLAYNAGKSDLQSSHMQRRPISPMRTLRTIVKRFTALVFGMHRWPAIRVVGDPKSQDFASALAEAQKMHHVFTAARNIGGACGTVGMSWRFKDGKPTLRAHAGGTLFVHEWEDQEEFIPAHVTQVYRYQKPGINPKTRKKEMQWFWHRRDWTLEADIAFVDVPDMGPGDPVWIVDPTNTFEHKDGFTHFVWVRNSPPDEDSDPDGYPDYHGVEEPSTALDVLNNVNVVGAVKNLDPTLILGIDKKQLDRGAAVRKGSDNALVVGLDGMAGYLELSGASITAGSELTEKQRRYILEAAECVVLDPDQAAASGMSSVAIEEVYAPMTQQAGVLRVQYGEAIERILEQQIRSYRGTVRNGTVIEVPVDDDGNEGEAVEVVPTLALAPRVKEVDVLGEDGKPTGEVDIEIIERELGEGGDVVLEWPPFFKPSPLEQQQKASSIGTANGGKPTMSWKSSVEKVAAIEGLDPEEEWQRLLDEDAQRQQREVGMFPTIDAVEAPAVDAEVDESADAPAPVDTQADAAVAAASAAADLEIKKLEARKKLYDALPVNKSAVEAVITVNEMRELLNPAWPPEPEPFGSMKVKAYLAMQEQQGAAIGKKVGDALGSSVADAAAEQTGLEVEEPPKPEPPKPPPPGGVPPAAPPVPPAIG